MKQAEAVWAVSVLGTATAREIAQLIIGEDATASDASSVLTICFREGWLIRRSRIPDGSDASVKYEYAIAAPDTVEEFIGGESVSDGLEADA